MLLTMGGKQPSVYRPWLPDPNARNQLTATVNIIQPCSQQLHHEPREKQPAVYRPPVFIANRKRKVAGKTIRGVPTANIPQYCRSLINHGLLRSRLTAVVQPQLSRSRNRNNATTSNGKRKQRGRPHAVCGPALLYSSARYSPTESLGETICGQSAAKMCQSCRR